MNVISLLWNKTASTLVLVVGAVASLLGMVWRIRRHAKAKMNSELQKQMVEAIARGHEAENDVRSMSDDDRLRWMREHGYVRD